MPWSLLTHSHSFDVIHSGLASRVKFHYQNVCYANRADFQRDSCNFCSCSCSFHRIYFSFFALTLAVHWHCLTRIHCTFAHGCISNIQFQWFIRIANGNNSNWLLLAHDNGTNKRDTQPFSSPFYCENHRKNFIYLHWIMFDDITQFVNICYASKWEKMAFCGALQREKWTRNE